MIPLLTAAGHRAVAPDLVGFGRSDKPVRREDYTYQRHVDWMRGRARAARPPRHHAGLPGLGRADRPAAGGRAPGALRPRRGGQHLPAHRRHAARRGVPARGGSTRRRRPSSTSAASSAAAAPPTSRPEVVAAYDAPFPDDRYKAGARQFPTLVPISPDDPAAAPNRKAWEVLRRWEKPFLTAFSDSDPITRGGDRVLRRARSRARKGQPHTTIDGGGHFLQEDKGEELAAVVVDFIARSR